MSNVNENELHEPKLYADKARVFRDMSALAERLYPLVEKFPNSYKNLLGYSLLDNLIKSLSYVKEAFDRKMDKKEYVIEAKIIFNQVIMQLRMAKTFHCISTKLHFSLFKELTDIDTQLKNWVDKLQ